MSGFTFLLVAVAAGVVDYYWWRTIKARTLGEALKNSWILCISAFVATYNTIHDWRYFPADFIGGSVGLVLAWKKKGPDLSDGAPENKES